MIILKDECWGKCPVCPNCANEFEDTEELDQSNNAHGDLKCPNCGYIYNWQRIVEIEYRTWPSMEKEGK